MSGKGGFAVVESLCRTDYLVAAHTVAIFTDHANLVYLFDTFGRILGIPRHTASKLMRWEIKLSAFWYVIENLLESKMSGPIYSPDGPCNGLLRTEDTAPGDWKP